MSEENDKVMSYLIKFVDDNFKRSAWTDILIVFPPLIIVILLLIIVLSVAFSTLPHVISIEWTPVLVSLLAIIVAYYSFIMGSLKYVNKRLAYKEAKRLEPNLVNKSLEAVCLLPPLVALRMENNPIKLKDLYEVNKELFAVTKLMENYYLR